MFLYEISYRVKSDDFSDLVSRSALAIGTSEEDAVSRLKVLVPKGSQDFHPVQIDSVMGHEIKVL